ncbi:DNA ligase (NAD+) [Selenomonas ruminantium]|uniref:DNA ligase n=1 Tax=Selenomonas ruminantium TaxID=971 RepID=A0A1M6U7A3_SELRU|nr:DNA ligase (NAD+) [Selenomonas ruminantium]
MNKQEYNALIAKIDYHMDLYYNQDRTEISDYDYDKLMSQLKKIEKEHPEWITADSPTQKIGGVPKREAGIKVTHDVPMLSIEDVFTKDDVVKWVDKIHNTIPDCLFSVETKIDGLSMTLRYEKDSNGKLKLVLAETRGDGFIGEDVTANAMVIPDVKKIIDLPYDSIQLRGEVYMAHEDFEAFNQQQEALGKKMAANPRNLAAGTLRQLDTSITKERRLKMFIFNVQVGPNELTDSHVAGLDLLSKHGVPVVYHRLCKTSEEIIEAIDAIGGMREDLPYDIDGAVVKIDNMSLREQFPSSSKYASGHIAYKYPPEEKIVEIDNIIVDVGRTGKLTFTAEFHDPETLKPVKLCGTNVSKATLHNQDYIADMHIGIGGRYKLFKSGEIIPKLNGCVREPREVYSAPATCPKCGHALIREEDSADIRCLNTSCPAQISRTLSYFTSINAMNIIGLGEKNIDGLIDSGYIHSFVDLYKLHDFRDELIEKKVIGKEKNTDKVLAAIEASKTNNPVQLLTGLGIRNVGRNTAKALLDHYDSITDLLSVSIDELTNINDIGETTAQYIYDFFHDAENVALVQELKECGLNMDVEHDFGMMNKLDGLKFVVTGTLPTLDRKEAIALIEKNGGKCVGSVSRKTDFLLAGENAGSKLDKAVSLNIRIIDEGELFRMIK